MAEHIEVDSEVMALLKSHAEPFVDSPNSVLRRLLGLAGPSPNGLRATAPVREQEPPRQGRKPRSRSRRARQSGARPRAQTGTILADSAYELPILEILDSHGGRAPTREVIDELGERLRDELLPADHEQLASGDIRWRNRAQFVRLKLIERGDMVKDSPRGLWELTDQGRDRLVSE
ncbi:MAG TPA: winged helix-turn-helix domain-containing protein [Gaiellaceae bacterium]|nr:winged helix-turn-helix domain-containing protein [Gaiellaceae bacterium]